MSLIPDPPKERAKVNRPRKTSTDFILPVLHRSYENWQREYTARCDMIMETTVICMYCKLERPKTLAILPCPAVAHKVHHWVKKRRYRKI